MSDKDDEIIKLKAELVSLRLEKQMRMISEKHGHKLLSEIARLKSVNSHCLRIIDGILKDAEEDLPFDKVHYGSLCNVSEAIKNVGR